VAGAFVRAGEFPRALQVAQATGALGIYGAHAQLRVGDREAGIAFLREGGESRRVHRILWGLEVDDAVTLDEAAGEPGTPSRALVEGVLREEPLGLEEEPLRALAVSWIAIAVEFRMLAAAARLSALLPAGAGVLAAALADHGLPREALGLALEHAEEPGAARVIGLAAHESHDLATAAEFLLRATESEEAPVRVYAKGVEALRQVGRTLDARTLLERGLDARPGSMLLDLLSF
jgi:hypothetical protein